MTKNENANNPDTVKKQSERVSRRVHLYFLDTPFCHLYSLLVRATARIYVAAAVQSTLGDEVTVLPGNKGAKVEREQTSGQTRHDSSNEH